MFVQGLAPLKGFAYGRLTRKIPLSQGFSSWITVHRTVIQFTFFGAPFGMGISPSADGDDWGFSPPSTPSAKLARLATAFLDRRFSFVKERNKLGSWRSQLLGNRRSRLSTRRCIPRFLVFSHCDMAFTLFRYTLRFDALLIIVNYFTDRFLLYRKELL